MVRSFLDQAPLTNQGLHGPFSWHRAQVTIPSPVDEKLGLAPLKRLEREVAPIETLPGTSRLTALCSATDPLAGESVHPHGVMITLFFFAKIFHA